ncbi:arylamine N-acetyltransferase family protein [Arthrobacter rhombi]|uniref:arylamine N-acetyltransferase family protein n=1 Tax=Arthrobacter rhombi TaxID=71253 RepID=UPI003FD4421E
MATTRDPQLTGSSWHLDSFDIDAYLSAVGVEREKPGLEFLERLIRAHLETFPFANIDILLGSHPGVEPVNVQRQIVDRRRGGYCFEHAQIFAAVAADLGYRVRRQLGRVHSPYNTRTHMTVAVLTEEAWFLTDPGFGFSIRGPLSLQHGAHRNDGGRVFSISHDNQDGVGRWSLHRDGELQHVTDDLKVQPADVRSGHLVTSTSTTAGPFTRALIASRYTADGHVTVTSGTRTVRRDGQPTRQETITTAEAVDGVRELGVSITSDEQNRLLRVLDGWAP